jgi:hypothetical protein
MMKSNQGRHRAAKPSGVAHSQLRKSLLVWWLLLVGIFLTGQMVERRPRYLSEMGFANEMTVSQTQSSPSDSFPHRDNWLGKR